MNVKDTLAGLGGLLIMGVMLVVGLSIAGIFIYGAAWASTKLLPWFSVFTWIAFAIVIKGSSLLLTLFRFCFKVVSCPDH